MVKGKRGVRKRDDGPSLWTGGQCHSDWLCLFIFAVHPKWDGKVGIPEPGAQLGGGSQQITKLEHCCCGPSTLNCPLQSWRGVVLSPEGLSFQPWEGHPACAPVLSHRFCRDDVTLHFSHIL